MGGFKKTEFDNNVWAAVWGKVMAQDAFKIVGEKRPGSKKYNNARNLLNYLGLSNEGIDTYLATQDENAKNDILDGLAWMTALRTQFRQTPMDLPQVPSANKIAKMMFHFKGFAFNFGKLQKDVMWKPAFEWAKSGGKQGSIMPLASMLGTQLFAAEARNLMRWLLTGKEPPEWGDEWVQRLLWDIFYSGGFGIAVDFAMHVGRGNNVFDFFGGPVVDDIHDIVITPIQKGLREDNVPDGMSEFIKSLAQALGNRVPYAQTIDRILGTNLSK